MTTNTNWNTAGESISIADSATLSSPSHGLWLCAREHCYGDVAELDYALRNAAMGALREALAYFGIKCPKSRAGAIAAIRRAARQINADGWATVEWKPSRDS